MRILVEVLISCGVLLATCAAQQMPAPKDGVQAGVASAIIANEKAVWEAAKQNDMKRFNELVAGDARMIFSSGVVTRAEYIQAIGRRNITDYKLADFEVFMPAPNVVIITYKATIEGVFNGKRVEPFTVREASVWINRGGKWLAVLNQETQIH
jgi:hypothetical protein